MFVTKTVGADSISARCKTRISGKFSVGDGFTVPRRKAFHNKKEPVFKDFEFFENRFFLFAKYNICTEKSLTRFGTGDPSPTNLYAFYAINLCIKHSKLKF